MLDLKPSFADSACFAALRGALLAEQQVLQLNTHICRERIRQLLGESLRHLELVVLPFVIVEEDSQLPKT